MHHVPIVSHVNSKPIHSHIPSDCQSSMKTRYLGDTTKSVPGVHDGARLSLCMVGWNGVTLMLKLHISSPSHDQIQSTS